MQRQVPCRVAINIPRLKIDRERPVHDAQRGNVQKSDAHGGTWACRFWRFGPERRQLGHPQQQPHILPAALYHLAGFDEVAYRILLIGDKWQTFIEMFNGKLIELKMDGRLESVLNRYR